VASGRLQTQANQDRDMNSTSHEEKLAILLIIVNRISAHLDSDNYGDTNIGNQEYFYLLDGFCYFVFNITLNNIIKSKGNKYENK
jgi:hypothetical protein